MRLITVSGPPCSGKTAVILKAIRELKEKQLNIGVVKFDCLTKDDREIYASHGVDCIVGLSGSLCPDHFFVSNINDCIDWGLEHSYDMLISESAGLCNRCSPHIKDIMAVCVVDNLMGINAPDKIGPMLKMADIIVITKGDVVSQTEREIFSMKIRQANPEGLILNVNGITGQGASELASLFSTGTEVETLERKYIRVSMPSALCSYCLGEIQIGKENQKGNIKRMNLD